MTSAPADTSACPQCHRIVGGDGEPPNFCPRCGAVLNPHLRRMVEAALVTEPSWIRLRVVSGCRLLALASVLTALLWIPTVIWTPFNPTVPWRAFAFLGLASLWLCVSVIWAKGTWRLTVSDASLRRVLAGRMDLVPVIRTLVILALPAWLFCLGVAVWHEYRTPGRWSLGERMLMEGPRLVRLVALVATVMGLGAAVCYRRRIDAVLGTRDPSLWSWPVLAGVVVLLAGAAVFGWLTHPMTGVVIVATGVLGWGWYGAWFARAARRGVGVRGVGG
ncbi:MAG: hypothetical protein KDA21_05940 [Phycisphaerales bacterium]|nr:hypothetical protein [Phycisphaerales bacterium]